MSKVLQVRLHVKGTEQVCQHSMTQSGEDGKDCIRALGVADHAAAQDSKLALALLVGAHL